MVRVRFAPSPTGSLHLGNARTAALNWLLARKAGGAFVLRVEDTDRQRNVVGAEAALLDDLRWLGLDWDEGPDVGGASGPYRQSERADRYSDCLQQLVSAGSAYEDDGAIRLRVPPREVRFIDGIAGETGLAAGEIQDFVVGRSDGSATYQLAVVVDDHAMGITDIVRGQDHLPNTPRQILLYEALGWQPPRFVHLPLVLGPDRSRLSKRHGATSVGAMREAGVVPAALLNYLVLLGWGPPDDREVLGADDLIAAWDLGAVSATNAVFDLDKLDWVNQQHLAALDPACALAAAEPFLRKAGMVVPDESIERNWWSQAVDLVRPAVRRLGELPDHLERAFWGAFWQPGAGEAEAVGGESGDALRAFAAASEAGQFVDPDAFRLLARDVAARTGVKGRALFHPLRLAVTGQDAGPELARLLPLIDAGARIGIQPPVESVARRISRALG